ncbi:MerR family DNA-binding transcriptional regulator [Candidatus Gottesmanbacteria bacterium]|nr:MerR family DNA-binding transcriptional regulator [Candidatus Gottesmanbacteria bacterium]
MKEKLLVISDTADYLGVSIDTIRRWDRGGVLHAVRPDGKTRYFRLTELVAVKNQEPRAKAPQVSRASNVWGIGMVFVRVGFSIFIILTIAFLLIPNETAKILTTVFNTLR